MAGDVDCGVGEDAGCVEGAAVCSDGVSCVEHHAEQQEGYLHCCLIRCRVKVEVASDPIASLVHVYFAVGVAGAAAALGGMGVT